LAEDIEKVKEEEEEEAIGNRDNNIVTIINLYCAIIA